MQTPPVGTENRLYTKRGSGSQSVGSDLTRASGEASLTQDETTGIQPFQLALYRLLPIDSILKKKRESGRQGTGSSMLSSRCGRKSDLRTWQAAISSSWETKWLASCPSRSARKPSSCRSGSSPKTSYRMPESLAHRESAAAENALTFTQDADGCGMCQIFAPFRPARIRTVSD